jgi:hypothetical protein
MIGRSKVATIAEYKALLFMTHPFNDDEFTCFTLAQPPWPATGG